ncbi:MAG: hypothetical protein SZ59_C0001G0185 [candidate division TM6 bacterium GW2011_GWF2_28_16]|nr:MAG: hypothetical protein SZ59_C0001G0185 [candidate division TM6 bacterium GW2011_GWF2_28_16]
MTHKLKLLILYIFTISLVLLNKSALSKNNQLTFFKKNKKETKYIEINQKNDPEITTPEQSKDKKKEIYPWLGTVAEVVSLIEQKSFRDVDFADFIQEALKAAMPHVDAHSAFFSKESYQETMESTSGKFSGIGVSVMSKALEDDTLSIIDVIQNGPADKAGLKAGDKIIQVSGESLRSLSTDEVINKLKGEVGTDAELKVVRDKKPLEFKVKRDIIKDQSSICYNITDQNIYYLSLKIFNEPAAKQVKELLEKANAGKANGLILDLRRNPGGILDSAVDMGSLFLPKGSLVLTTKNNAGIVTTEYKTKTNPVLNSNIPIFILIDNFTASAAEILAGNLQYYSKKLIDPKTKKSSLMVFLVGMHSFGKGSVQEVIPISNGCALKLTTLLYFLPDNISTQAKGIEPDFLVKPKIIPSEEMQWVEDLYGKESSLKYHITPEEVFGKAPDKKAKKVKPEEKEKTWEERQKEAINNDVQVKTSVNLINLFNFAKQCNPKLVETREKTLSFLKQNYLTDELFNINKVE